MAPQSSRRRPAMKSRREPLKSVDQTERHQMVAGDASQYLGRSIFREREREELATAL